MKKSCMKKRSMPQKCLTVVLTLCLLFSCLPDAYAKYFPQPDTGSCGPNAEYSFVDGVMTISGTGEVTRHYNSWPTGVVEPNQTTKLVIEDGITSLSGSNFMGLNFDQVEIPDSMTYIGSGAFSGTPWMAAQTDEFVMVGSSILLDYNGPGGEVTVPDTVRSIAGGAFSRSDITSITVGSNVEDIGDNAFACCPKLENVSISDSISHIESGILDITPWLRAQTEDFVIVGDGVLINYKGPDGVVEIPDTVRSIADWSLWYYYGDENPRTISITEITIPETVTAIGRNAFGGGSANNKVIVNEPVIVHGAPGSAAQEFVEQSNSFLNLFRFVPFGQEDGSRFNFMKLTMLLAEQFSDVNEDDWFYDAVEAAYNICLMEGKTEAVAFTKATFDPAGGIKLSEAITVASRVRDIYYYEQTDFTAAEGVMWYQPYVDYALDNDIITEVPSELNRPATRAEFASLLAAALPEREFEAIHGEILFTDLDEEHPAYDAIMLLAQAGVMEGKGEGRFDPDAQVKRCEAAAMLTRCVQPAQRVQPEATGA